jgi:hypothetical protein
MWRRACSRTGRSAIRSAGVRRRSRVPVHSAALVAYLATYAATLVSVTSPLVVTGRMSSWRPHVRARVGSPGAAGVVTLTARAAWSMAVVSSAMVTQAGGASAGPAGPSSRMMAWKWTTPRRWYSATLA